MINYEPQITEFLRENFTPSTLENATHKLTTLELLALLFDVFPQGSIDDYELYNILNNLNYKPTTTKEISENKLTFVWCLLKV